MKWLNNVSVRAKLLIISVPLAVALIISVVFMGAELSSTESQMTAVYYDTLYQVNSNLLNADRDFYQSIEAAMEYYDFANGFTSAPPEFAASLMPGQLADYQENKQQVYDRVTAAEEIASKYTDLFLMLPYVLTLLLLVFFSKKNHPPNAAGEPWDKSKR